MDFPKRQFFRQSLTVKLASSGVIFQDFVADIFVAAYGNEFSRIKARGRAGDGGCDGFLRTSGTVVQCYGADATADRRGTYVARKIAADFEKARASFRDAMRGWQFAHNLFEGLPHEAEIALAKLQADNPEIVISSITREGFERMIFSLADEAQIEDLLGQAPTDTSYSGIDVAALQAFLKGLANHPVASDDGADILRVPREKLAHNRLSQYSAAALDRRFERDVIAFIDRSGDPLIGDQASNTLNQKYLVLRAQRKSPDEILSELLYFILGEGRITTPSIAEDAAAHAILSYFFFRCDIFEDAPPAIQT